MTRRIDQPPRAPFARAAAGACALALVLAPACGSSPGPLPVADASPTVDPDGAAPRDAWQPAAPDTSRDALDSGEPETVSEAAALATEATAPSDIDAGAATSTDSAAALFPDAGVPAGVQGAAIESVVVPLSGSVTSRTSLARGGAYLLKAVGAVNAGGTLVDAEFGGFDAAGNGAMDLLSGLDVGVDVGLLEVHAMNHYTTVPPGPGRMKWYGAFRNDHTYYMLITGAGAPLTMKLAAPPAPSAAGISVSVFELAPPPPAIFQPMPGAMPASPAPPKVGRSALETLYVPVLKTVVSSKLTTDKTAVYLLQASGTAICGGGGLQSGDADYMDWTAAGAGFNDGEGGVDFGLGVDELNVGHGAGVAGGGYAHRLRGWGPFRNDHVYFMLYAGTGSPLSFVYWDVAYGDNSTTQALSVDVFPVP